MKKRLLLIIAVLLAVMLFAVLPAFAEQMFPAQETTAADRFSYFISMLSTSQAVDRIRSSPISRAIAAGILALIVGGVGMIISALKKPKETKKTTPVKRMVPEEDAAPTTVTLKPKTIVGDRYVIDDVLGSGEYGVTYSAQDRSTGARVAFIEYLPANAAKREEGGISLHPASKEKEAEYESGKAEFLEDANSLTSLGEYGHSARILDRFERNGTAYCVSEYLDNISPEMYIPNAFYDLEFMKTEHADQVV